MTKFTGKSKTELLGYVSLEMRIAQLQVAGLRTKLARDELYDSLIDREDLPNPPILPRHFQADMADVAEYNRYYQARRAEINDKIRVALEERKRPRPGAAVGSPEALQASGAEPPGNGAVAQSAKSEGA